MFSNSMPDTYQNGMAVFPSPESGYAVLQPHTVFMVPQTPPVYGLPQFAAYQDPTSAHSSLQPHTVFMVPQTPPVYGLPQFAAYQDPTSGYSSLQPQTAYMVPQTPPRYWLPQYAAYQDPTAAYSSLQTSPQLATTAAAAATATSGQLRYKTQDQLSMSVIPVFPDGPYLENENYHVRNGVTDSVVTSISRRDSEFIDTEGINYPRRRETEERSRSVLQPHETVQRYQSNVLPHAHVAQSNPVRATGTFNGTPQLFGQPQIAQPSLPTTYQMINAPVETPISVQNNEAARSSQTAKSSSSSFRQSQTQTSNTNIWSKDLISTEHLTRMKNIVFLDLDNWSRFFQKLPRSLPVLTFVWGFFGGKNRWIAPSRWSVFQEVKRGKRFYLEQCGKTKNATDFSMVLEISKMDDKLPMSIPFTIVSGDKSFNEVVRKLQDSERTVKVVNPHTAARISNDKIYDLVTNITDT